MSSSDDLDPIKSYIPIGMIGLTMHNKKDPVAPEVNLYIT